VRFRLTIPCDEQYVPAVRQLAERVAQCAGYSAAEAVRVASSVGHAAQTLIRQLGGDARQSQPVEVCFQREGAHLEVWLQYAASDSDSAVLDPAISGEALRQGMDSVEFGRRGEVSYCRLCRALPHDKVDHKCEAPRDGK
jgi:hypothetical protein